LLTCHDTHHWKSISAARGEIMTMYKVGQSSVYVNMKGRGEPLLFLHGVPDTSEVWNNAIEAFSGEYQCIAPDLPGFGCTLSPRNFEYSLDKLANFVDQLLVSLRVTDGVHMVIHDIGGIVGLAFALTHPDKVKSLTIMDTTFFSDYEWHAMALTWRKPIIGELAMYLMGHKQFSAAMKKSAPILTDAQIRSNYDSLTWRNRRMILRFYRALDPVIFKPWEAKLPTLAKRFPTQVIWGQKDTFLPVALADRFGTDKVHILQKTGHWPMLEEALEVHKLIRNNIKLAD
jgi:pimeloyl-ACP methyl ester carboxylesterase